MRDIDIDVQVKSGQVSDVIQVATNFDWISPFIAISRDFAGGATAFLISVHCGWTGYEIINFLKANGVEAYTAGSMIVDNTFVIQVAGEDEGRALFLLGMMGLL